MNEEMASIEHQVQELAIVGSDRVEHIECIPLVQTVGGVDNILKGKMSKRTFSGRSGRKALQAITKVVGEAFKV